MSRHGVAELPPPGRVAAPVAYLLDVNVLLALLDPLHVEHARAHEWFSHHGVHGWASCVVTQNGAVRILAQPRYTNPVDTVAEALDIVGELCRHPAHTFWPCDVSLLDSPLIDSSRLMTPGQVTDTFLLALAVAHRGQLASLDHRLVTDAVSGGRDALHLIK